MRYSMSQKCHFSAQIRKTQRYFSDTNNTIIQIMYKETSHIYPISTIQKHHNFTF